MATREIVTNSSRPASARFLGDPKLLTSSGYRHHAVLHVGISDLPE